MEFSHANTHKEDNSMDIKFDLINTKYTCIETIGNGSYGIVCKALDTDCNRLVAIKKIPGAFDNYVMAKRTYREIKIVKNLKHENIIAIIDILRPQDNECDLAEFKDVYVVFDYMESDLHRVIQSKEQLSDDHIRYFLYQILRGLKYLHTASIIHRDLKPSNILVNGNCDLKIADFGMSRSVCKVDNNSMFLTQYVATRWYRAPELLYSCEYTNAIDMWSIGCIFSEMLLKRPLFPSKDTYSLLRAIFSTLGVSNKTFFKSIESELFRKIIIAAIGKQNKRLNFRSMYPMLCDSGFDLLIKLLEIEANKRINACNALEHSFLLKYRDIQSEISAPQAVNFNFDNEEFMNDTNRGENLRLLKKAIFKEADCYQAQNQQHQQFESNDNLIETISKIDDFLNSLNEEPKCDKKSEHSDIRKILKQKLLDSKRLESTGINNKKRVKRLRHSLSESHLCHVRGVPIRPRTEIDNEQTARNNKIKQQNHVFINLNQPIFILSKPIQPLKQILLLTTTNQSQKPTHDIDNVMRLFSMQKVNETFMDNSHLMSMVNQSIQGNTSCSVASMTPK